MAKRKINLGGQEVMAEEIEFEPDQGGEKWSTYILHDGTTLRVKAVLSDVLRVEGLYNATGDPIYTINASIVVASNSPESLRKKQ